MPRHRLDGVSVSMLVVACLGMGMRVRDAEDKGEVAKGADGEEVKAKNMDGGDTENDKETEGGASATSKLEEGTKAGSKERQKQE